MRMKYLLGTAAMVLGGTLAAAPVMAASSAGMSQRSTEPVQSAAPTMQDGQAARADNADGQRSDTRTLVRQSVQVVEDMKKDPQLVKLMQQAKGIFIVPDFGRGGLIVGGRGGSGVLLSHRDSRWSDPLFYTLGGVSVGAQAGASGGEVAMLLMTKDAVNSFKSKSNFSLNAGAGLSIATYSANGQASWGKSDIVQWSSTSGAYAGATVGVTDVSRSDADNKAFYGHHVTPQEVLSGNVQTARADKLQQVLPD